MWLLVSRLIYDLSLGIYDAAGYFMSFFFASGKARLWARGHRNALKVLEQKILKDEKYVWFHCASLGEFEQGRPLMEAFRSTYPRYRILLTFFSPSGYEIKKNYAGADVICYLPLDSKKNASAFLSIVNPGIAIFIKYEFWHHYLKELKEREIPALLVSSTFRREQPFFQWYGALWRDMLNCFRYIFVQNPSSLDLLKEIGVVHCSIAQDIRFDRVSDIRKNKKELPLIREFTGNSPVLIAGSTWTRDEKILSDYINLNETSGQKYIIAPHNLSESGLAALENMLPGITQRYSHAMKFGCGGQKVLIIDNIGMLSSVYAYADIAYVGGGFGKSVHNILEAAVYGIPVIFGPNHKKSIEALELISQKGAFVIHDLEELIAVTNALKDRDLLKQAGETNLTYIENRTGGTAVIMNYLKDKIPN